MVSFFGFILFAENFRGVHRGYLTNQNVFEDGIQRHQKSWQQDDPNNQHDPKNNLSSPPSHSSLQLTPIHQGIATTSRVAYQLNFGEHQSCSHTLDFFSILFPKYSIWHFLTPNFLHIPTNGPIWLFASHESILHSFSYCINCGNSSGCCLILNFWTRFFKESYGH